jgi:predicted naringenin-chalcone synthase
VAVSLSTYLETDFMTSPRSMPTVLGLGTALPEHSMTQDEATLLAQTICARDEKERRLVSVLFRKAGVKQRYTAVPYRTALDYVPAPESVVASNGSEAGGNTVAALEAPVHLGPTTAQRMDYYREHAPPLAIRSATAALAESGVAAGEITHLVTVSCTGFFAPGIDAALIEGLGLPRTTERIQVGFMGCHGAVNGLRVAMALIAADPRRRVLLCAVELCLHYCFEWDPLSAVGNAVFADGSASVIIGPAEDGDRRLRPSVCGSFLIPDSADAMTWDIGDHGFKMMLSPRVPDLIGAHLRSWMERWLAEQGLTIDLVGGWAVHPGGPRVLTATEEALGLDRSATAVSRDVLETCGNMSSPTILFILDRFRRMDMPRPYVALGFGPGLAAEAALFT